MEELAFVASILVYARWALGVRRAGTFEWASCSPERLLAGVADTPFQHRVLVIALARAIRPFAPSARAAFEVVEVLGAVGLVVATRMYLTALLGGGTPARRAAMALAPLTAMLIPLHYVLLGEVPGLRRYVYFPWDLPAAAAFVACIALLRARRWRAYYPAFVLATLTRETTVFLPIVQILVGPLEGETDRSVAAHAAAQFVIWAALKLLVRWAYRHNPGGGAYTDTLTDNVLAMADVGALVRVLGVAALLWVPALLGASRVEDAFARRALRVLPLWLLGMLAVANLHELRVFGELVAAVVLPAWVLLIRALLRETGPSRPT